VKVAKPIAVVGDATSLRAFLTTVDDARERRLADKLIACMNAAGFSGQLRVAPPAPPIDGDGWDVIAQFDTNIGVVPDYVELVSPLDATGMAALLDTGEGETSATAGKSFGGGCLGRAASAVYKDATAWDELADALDALETAVSEDASVVGALSAWANCFNQKTQAGVTSADEAQERLFMQASNLLGPSMPGAAEQPGEPSLANAAAPGSPGVGPPATAAELSVRIARLNELKATEQAWAVADRECSAGGLTAAIRTAEDARYSKFVAEHAPLLSRVGFRG
jgi:hypothetical protein